MHSEKKFTGLKAHSIRGAQKKLWSSCQFCRDSRLTGNDPFPCFLNSMTRRSRLNSSLFTACCVFALTWSSLAGAEAASPASSEAALNEARLHFSNGVELLQASPPNYQDAYPQFLLAYEKTGQSWKVLGNLGLCALHLERDGEAIDYYRRYLDEGGDEIDPAERKAIEREILLIQGNQAQLKLTAPEKNLRITLRREGSTAPTQIYHMTEGAWPWVCALAPTE